MSMVANEYFGDLEDIIRQDEEELVEHKEQIKAIDDQLSNLNYSSSEDKDLITELEKKRKDLVENIKYLRKDIEYQREKFHIKRVNVSEQTTMITDEITDFYD